MAQKYGYRANEVLVETFNCLICGESAGFNWSDLHGEGMCNRCGTPYQLVHYNERKERIEGMPKISIAESWIPIIKRYWEETHHYMGLGQIIIWRDYPEALEGRRAFNEWCEQHKDVLPKEKEEEEK